MSQRKTAKRSRSEPQASAGGPPQGRTAKRSRSEPQASAGGKLRAFFAVELGERARREAHALAQELAKAPGGDAVRWVRPEGYHVTLRFLGSVPSERVPAVLDRVRAEAAALAPFELQLGVLHGFPSPRRPRVVILDVEPATPIAELAAAVERGVVSAGFPPEERPYHAHLTLGRVRQSTPLALLGVADPAPFPVRSVVLFRSDLSPSGATYTPLERIALGGNASP